MADSAKLEMARIIAERLKNDELGEQAPMEDRFSQTALVALDSIDAYPEAHRRWDEEMSNKTVPSSPVSVETPDQDPPVPEAVHTPIVNQSMYVRIKMGTHVENEAIEPVEHFWLQLKGGNNETLMHSENYPSHEIVVDETRKFEALGLRIVDDTPYAV